MRSQSAAVILNGEPMVVREDDGEHAEERHSRLLMLCRGRDRHEKSESKSKRRKESKVESKQSVYSTSNYTDPFRRPKSHALPLPAERLPTSSPSSTALPNAASDGDEEVLVVVKAVLSVMPACRPSSTCWEHLARLST